MSRDPLRRALVIATAIVGLIIVVDCLARWHGSSVTTSDAPGHWITTHCDGREQEVFIPGKRLAVTTDHNGCARPLTQDETALFVDDYGLTGSDCCWIGDVDSATKAACPPCKRKAPPDANLSAIDHGYNCCSFGDVDSATKAACPPCVIKPADGGSP